jgi:rod shape-determining protein MreD
MTNLVLKNILRFFILILFQVLILDNIHLSGYINPYLYVLFILLLPFETPKWLLLISAFFIGLGVDMFSNTIGMHASACTFMAFCRPLVLKTISSKQEYKPGISPTIKDLGFKWFFYYSAILTFLHHFLLFNIETFRFSEFLTTFNKIIISTIFSLILIIITQYIFYKQQKDIS